VLGNLFSIKSVLPYINQSCRGSKCPADHLDRP
jgi:hypothetical protein